MSALPFEALDYIYTPSADVAGDLVELESVLGGHVVFAIEEMGTRVAMVELAQAPHLVLAGHLQGDRPVFVYRVASLPAAIEALRGRGWQEGRMIELPMGPACAFSSGGGHRFAIYERTRAAVVGHFAGRRDF